MDIAGHTSGTMKKLVVALFAILALSACATPDVDQTVANFDEEKFAEDLNNCRGGPFIVTSVKGVGNAVIGSVAKKLLRGAGALRRGGRVRGEVLWARVSLGPSVDSCSLCL